MDISYDVEPPEEYKQVKWMVNILIVLMGVGWTMNYGDMLWYSYKDSTYCMSLLSLCCNIGWELTYVLVYPSPNPYEFWVIVCWLMINFGIMWNAACALPREFAHAPLIAGNAKLITGIGVLAGFGGQVALAAEMGPALAYSWGAFICQTSLSVGGIAQLLNRNSTRGLRLRMLFSRFLGSCCTICFATLRYMYWYEGYSWIVNPVVLWGNCIFFVLDPMWVWCFFRIRKSEIQARSVKKL